IFRFRLLDVDIVINRSLVYSLLTIFTVSVYLFSVRIFQDLFAGALAGRERTVSLAGVFLAAAAFHPALKKIQGFVDRAFFRQGFNYQKTILDFTEKSQKILHGEGLIDLMATSIQAVIPVDRQGVWVGEVTEKGSRVLFSRDFSEETASPDFLTWPAARLWARQGATRTEEGVDFSRDEELAQLRAEVILPLPFPSAALRGFLVLGKKKSGQRYSRDDLELLVTLTDELALNLEKIRLQEEVVYERASREKLDELNRLKTEFISNVSHELRTPLTSIQGMSEILQEGKVRDEAKREELLGVVAAESARVSRLIHNILDFGKIELQQRVYHFAQADIGPLIEEAVRVFRPILDSRGFTVRLNLPPQAVSLRVDADAVKQALLNLIDNAIKYSPGKKEVEIELLDRGHEV
ncbi:MAG: HAMP domain-containing sensor histidine kinase, partial [Acidobacteriota bacterium]